jgi:PAS domain-containing protein
MTKLRQCAETVAAVLTEKLCARPGDVNPAGVADIIEQVLNATAREQEEVEHQRLGEVQANASERLTTLLNASPAVIYSFKASGTFAPTFVSTNIERLFGYAPCEASASTLTIFSARRQRSRICSRTASTRSNTASAARTAAIAG